MKREKLADKSIRVEQREKIGFDLSIREFPWSEKQKSLIELIQNKQTKVVFVQGPSGSAKTHIGAYAGLQLLKSGRLKELTYIRQPVESSKYNLGYLKGDLQEKLTPYAQPLDDKLNEFLSTSQISKLKEDSRIICAPIGHMRGRTFNATYMLLDEAQNLAVEDFLLIMTRLGKYSKLIITGDVMQPDIKNSAFQKVAGLFDNEESKAQGIHTFIFDKSDIFRNESLAFIIEKFENAKF